MRPLLAVALLAAIAPAAPVPKALKKTDDKTALVGTWTVTAMSINGRDRPISTDTFVFDADGGVKTWFRNEEGGNTWTWALDPEASPPRMTWAAKGRASNWQLVYELEGDNLKVGFINKGANPPAKVEPTEGLTLYVMTRDTSAK